MICHFFESRSMVHMIEFKYVPMYLNDYHHPIHPDLYLQMVHPMYLDSYKSISSQGMVSIYPCIDIDMAYNIHGLPMYWLILPMYWYWRDGKIPMDSYQSHRLPSLQFIAHLPPWPVRPSPGAQKSRPSDPLPDINQGGAIMGENQ